MKQLNKKKMIFWRSFTEGQYEYFTEYTIVKTPMWVFKLLSRITRFFEKLKWMCTEDWKATMETIHDRNTDWQLNKKQR